MSKGIIDPTKVVRAALQGAASIAGLLHHHRGDGGGAAAQAGRGEVKAAAAWAAWAAGWTIDRAIHP